MGSVIFRAGDIFESGADLTALPCSIKGHISASSDTRVQRFQLPLPSPLGPGEIEIHRFPGLVSRIVAWAASVSDRTSSPAVIRKIGERLGAYANENRWIQILESPLLGTGAGGLDPLIAGRALADGFLSTCSTDALLIIYGHIATTMNKLRGIDEDKGRNESEDVPRIHESGIDPIGPRGDAHSVFISYSHRDQRFLNDLRVHLKPLERIAVLDAWSDKQIAPGSEWREAISLALRRAKVAVLLVTPSFLASDFIHDHELTPLLKEAGNGNTRILWIPLRACSYKSTALSKYQALIPPDRPLAEMKANRDKAWVRTCDEIMKALN